MTLIDSWTEVKIRVIHSMKRSKNKNGISQVFFSFALHQKVELDWTKVELNVQQQKRNFHKFYYASPATWHSFYLHMKTMKLMCDRTMTKPFYEVVNKQIYLENVIMNTQIGVCVCVIYTPNFATRTLYHFIYTDGWRDRALYKKNHTLLHNRPNYVVFKFYGFFFCSSLRFNYKQICIWNRRFFCDSFLFFI